VPIAIRSAIEIIIFFMLLLQSQRMLPAEP